MGDDRAPGERRRLVEEAAEDDGVAVRVERLDGGDDVRRRIADARTAARSAAMTSRRRRALDDDDRGVGLRPDPGALGGDDEDVGRAELAQRRHQRRPDRRRPAGEDHPPAPDEVGSGPATTVIRRRYRRRSRFFGELSRSAATTASERSRGQDDHAQLGHLADRVGRALAGVAAVADAAVGLLVGPPRRHLVDEHAAEVEASGTPAWRRRCRW